MHAGGQPLTVMACRPVTVTDAALSLYVANEVGVVTSTFSGSCSCKKAALLKPPAHSCSSTSAAIHTPAGDIPDCLMPFQCLYISSNVCISQVMLMKHNASISGKVLGGVWGGAGRGAKAKKLLQGVKLNKGNAYKTLSRIQRCRRKPALHLVSGDYS